MSFLHRAYRFFFYKNKTNLMIKKSLLIFLCITTFLSNAQTLPKGKLIKDTRLSTSGINIGDYFHCNNSTMFLSLYDLKYYRINSNLNNVSPVPELDSINGILYNDNDRIVYIKDKNTNNGTTKDIWQYRFSTNTHKRISSFNFNFIHSGSRVYDGRLYVFAHFVGSSLFVGGIRNVLFYVPLNTSDADLNVEFIDFSGGLTPANSTENFIEINGNLFCSCNGQKDDIYPYLNAFSNELCSVSTLTDSAHVYNLKEMMFNDFNPSNGAAILGKQGNNVFLSYWPGLLNDKGREPYKFSTSTNSYDRIQDLATGKNSQGLDANSSISNVIYDNDFLYFSSSSDATPVSYATQLYSYDGAKIQNEGLTNFTPILPLGNGYVLVTANNSAFIRNINTSITNTIIDEATGSQLILPSSYTDIFKLNLTASNGKKDSTNRYYYETKGKFILSFNGNFHVLDPETHSIKRISDNSFTDPNSMLSNEKFYSNRLSDSIVRFYYQGRNSQVGNEPAYIDINLYEAGLITSLENDYVKKSARLLHVEIYSVQGLKLATGSEELVNELKQGTYIIRYLYDDGSVISEKIGKL